MVLMVLMVLMVVLMVPPPRSAATAGVRALGVGLPTGYEALTTSLGPPLVGLTAAPVPLTTDSMPPDPFRNTVNRSLRWMPEAAGAWNPIAFSMLTPWSK